MMSNGITWWELMIALQLSGKFLSVLEVPFPVKNPLYKVNRTRSSKKITTYCCNILIKPKSSASESIEDIKRYSWAWMSDRCTCTSFSQQEWVLCHAKTTHLSINTLPTYGAVWHQKHDVIHVFWQKQIHCHLQMHAIHHFKDKDTCM